MPDSNCRSCGSNLEIITVCKLCNQPLIFALGFKIFVFHNHGTSDSALAMTGHEVITSQSGVI